MTFAPPKELETNKHKRHGFSRCPAGMAPYLRTICKVGAGGFGRVTLEAPKGDVSNMKFSKVDDLARGAWTPPSSWTLRSRPVLGSFQPATGEPEVQPMDRPLRRNRPLADRRWI